MSLDLPTENWSLHFNSHAYVERDSIIRHNTIIHNLISTHTQTNWSKRANSVRPYEKIIIAAGDTLIPHSSLLIPHFSRKSVYSLHFRRVSAVCGTHIQRLFYLYKRLSALFALNENKPWGTLWVFVNCTQTLRLDATGSHCRHYIA